jgi:hypothetical protein
VCAVRAPVLASAQAQDAGLRHRMPRHPVRPRVLAPGPGPRTQAQQQPELDTAPHACR